MKILAGALLIVIASALTPPGARAQASGGGTTAAPQARPEATLRSFDDPLAPAGWKRYEIQVSTGQVLSIYLPSPPEASTNRVNAWAAGVGINYAYMTRTPTDFYLVSYVTGLSAKVTDDPQARSALYENFWGDFAKGVKAGLAKRGADVEFVAHPARKRAVGAFEAVEQDFTMGEMHGTYLALVSGGYGYAIATVSGAGPLGDGNKSFLKSFTLRAQR